MDNSDSNNTLTKQEKALPVHKRKRNRIPRFPEQINVQLDPIRLLLLDQTAGALKKSRNELIRDYNCSFNATLTFMNRCCSIGNCFRVREWSLWHSEPRLNFT